jgi:hypothetical protein
MELAKVFISSILDPNKEDLRAEREAVRVTVEKYRFLTPWAFEKAPASVEALDESYLRHIEECDLFIIIVGTKATDPVTAELQRAKDRCRPILVFAKEAADRTPLAKALLDSAGVKYATFHDTEQLKQRVTDAIEQALVSGLRALREHGGGSVLAQLRQLAEKFESVRIRPIVPTAFEQDTFFIREVKADVITLTAPAPGYTAHIPTSRVSEVLFFGYSDKPQVLLDGRLQLISTTDSWKFFDEKPSPDSPLGFCKPSGITDPRPREIQKQQEARGMKFHWGALAEIGRRFEEGYRIVYDDDGRYFRIADPVGDLVLMRKAG